MKTRTELLDRLIESLKENQYHLYKCWIRSGMLEEWAYSTYYRDFMKYQSEINELQIQYD